MKNIKKKSGKDVSSDKRAIQKLKREVEKAKRALSSVHETKIEIEDIVEGVHVDEVKYLLTQKKKFFKNLFFFFL
jgi:heat shock protein 5